MKSILTATLSSGRLAGEVGAIDTSVIELGAIEDGVKRAEVLRKSGTDEEARELLAIAKALLWLRTALVDRDWGSVEAWLTDHADLTSDGTGAGPSAAASASAAAAATAAATAAAAVAAAAGEADSKSVDAAGRKRGRRVSVFVESKHAHLFRDEVALAKAEMQNTFMLTRLERALATGAASDLHALVGGGQGEATAFAMRDERLKSRARVATLGSVGEANEEEDEEAESSSSGSESDDDAPVEAWKATPLPQFQAVDADGSPGGGQSVSGQKRPSLEARRRSTQLRMRRGSTPLDTMTIRTEDLDEAIKYVGGGAKRGGRASERSEAGKRAYLPPPSTPPTHPPTH